MRTFAGIQWHAGVRKCGSIGNQKLGAWTQPVHRRQAANLRRHRGLPVSKAASCSITEFLDHIECAVRKLAQIGRVASTRLDVLVDGRLGLEIDKDHMNVFAPHPRQPHLPEWPLRRARPTSGNVPTGSRLVVVKASPSGLLTSTDPQSASAECEE